MSQEKTIMICIVRTWIARGVGLWLCVTLFSLSALGQAAKGAITGSVEDFSGAALKGAQLKLMPLGAVVVTDDQGQFTFLAVPAGSYTVSVSFVGFKPAEMAVQVTENQVQNADIKGSSAQFVGKPSHESRQGGRFAAACWMSFSRHGEIYPPDVC
jgi:hypothetical protein